MKLYVWENVLTDWSSGMMIAIAENVEEARKQLLADCNYLPKEDLAKEPTVYFVNEPFAVSIWGGG